MSMYLIVKVAWIAAGLVGVGAQRAIAADWIALNAVTVVMAGIGVALGLGLAQPWGLRIPAPFVVVGAWVGGGFLVPLLPYLLAVALLSALGVAGDRGAQEASDLPGWESAFLAIGFAGMALGLAIGLPAFVWRRWPTAFVGDARCGRPTWGTRPGLVLARVGALAAAGATATAQIMWSLGVTLGLHPGRQHDVAVEDRLLWACWGAWALVAASSLWRLVASRPHRGGRRWLSRVLAFTASGCGFAWGAWGLFAVILRPAGYLPEQYVPVAVALHAMSVFAGLVLLGTVLIGPERATQ